MVLVTATEATSGEGPQQGPAAQCGPACPAEPAEAHQGPEGPEGSGSGPGLGPGRGPGPWALCPGPALSLYLPASQASQAALPVDSLNLPSSHAVQGPPSGPVCPGVQGCATGTGRSGSGSTICDTLSVVSLLFVLRFRERWDVRDGARDACFASMSPTHVCVCELSED